MYVCISSISIHVQEKCAHLCSILPLGPRLLLAAIESLMRVLVISDLLQVDLTV